MTNAQDFRNAAQGDAWADEIFEDGSEDFQMYEDDGTFFVEQFGLRACFSIGQDSTRTTFNRTANGILRHMGYTQTYNGTGRV